MTIYDEPSATDGHGGPHPLAGVPQEALDAARKALEEACSEYELPNGSIHAEPITLDVLDADFDEIAHSVLMSGLVAMRAKGAVMLPVLPDERLKIEVNAEWGVRWQDGVVWRYTTKRNAEQGIEAQMVVGWTGTLVRRTVTMTEWTDDTPDEEDKPYRVIRVEGGYPYVFNQQHEHFSDTYAEVMTALGNSTPRLTCHTMDFATYDEAVEWAGVRAPIPADNKVHDSAGRCEPGYHRGSTNMGMKTCHCGQIPITPPEPTPVRTVRVAGQMESGVDDAGHPWARAQGVTLLCYEDGSVRWEP